MEEAQAGRPSRQHRTCAEWLRWLWHSEGGGRAAPIGAARRSQDQLSMMASAGKRRSHKRYTGVYREGSIASSFYVLTAGTVKESS